MWMSELLDIQSTAGVRRRLLLHVKILVMMLPVFVVEREGILSYTIGSSAFQKGGILRTY